MALRPEELMGVIGGVNRMQSGLAQGAKLAQEINNTQRKSEIDSILDLIKTNTFIDTKTDEIASPVSVAQAIRAQKVPENWRFATKEDTALTPWQQAQSDHQSHLRDFRDAMGIIRSKASDQASVRNLLSTVTALTAASKDYNVGSLKQEEYRENRDMILKNIFSVHGFIPSEIVTKIEESEPGLLQKLFDIEPDKIIQQKVVPGRKASPAKKKNQDPLGLLD